MYREDDETTQKICCMLKLGNVIVYVIWNDTVDITVFIVSKGLTAAVLNTSKLFDEIGDLYAKQVNIYTYSALTQLVGH